MRPGGAEETGEYVSREDASILLDAIGFKETGLLSEEEGSLTYGEYLAIRSCSQTGKLPEYRGSYKREQPIRKEDWYQAFRILAAESTEAGTIWETAIFVMKTDEQKKRLYSVEDAEEGGRSYRSSAFADAVFQQVNVLVQGEELLTITSVEKGSYLLENVWIKEVEETQLQCFFHQVDFSTAYRADLAAAEISREEVADLHFQEGSLTRIHLKQQKEHGKLLRMTEQEAEIEGVGSVALDDRLEIYRLYDQLKTLRTEDLKIGYEDSDYVIEEGRLCAVLVSRRENADMIRVLLRNTKTGSAYYDEVILRVDEEQICLLAEEMEVGERRRYQSKNLTDRIWIMADGIKKEDPLYRGMVECFRMEQGIVVINELALEEYLYAVVPSEMPAAYPAEALKAQAVCARTYGYRFILHAGLPEYGAHVDDTTAYQVYHNAPEKAAATTAVKDTDGWILTYQGEPAENYYYSTSCGVGADASVWNASETLPYLQAAVYEEKAEQVMELCRSGKMSEITAVYAQEESFRKRLLEETDGAWEKEEPWFRWSYSVGYIDSEELLARINKRYQAAPEKVLTKQGDGCYASEPIKELGQIYDLRIEKRGAGGVVRELLIEAEKATIRILSEYNIRSVLCDGRSEILRQDGTRVTPASLLPSGFFVMETGKSDGSVVRYTLTGGGYGHGVGMSQNGAKVLGERGSSYQEILSVYFPGCLVEKVSDGEEEMDGE